MKRYVLLTTLCACLAGSTARAQDSPTALAEKQEAEERYKTLSARIENLEEALQAYQKRMNVLAEELKSVRDEIARLGNNSSVNAATQKSLENLAEAIKEVDRKRMADNEKVIATVTAEVKKALGEKPSGPPRVNPPTTPNPPRSATERGYEYAVQANDNPYVIASKLAKQGVKVTTAQIKEANPQVKDWTKLKIGQKLFIPAPPQ